MAQTIGHSRCFMFNQIMAVGWPLSFYELLFMHLYGRCILKNLWRLFDVWPTFTKNMKVFWYFGKLMSFVPRWLRSHEFARSFSPLSQSWSMKSFHVLFWVKVDKIYACQTLVRMHPIRWLLCSTSEKKAVWFGGFSPR